MKRSRFSWQEMLNQTPANRVESIVPAPPLNATARPLNATARPIPQALLRRNDMERQKLQQRISRSGSPLMPLAPEGSMASRMISPTYSPETAASKMMGMGGAGPYAQELAYFSPQAATDYATAQKAPEMVSAASRTALAGAGAAEFQTGQLPVQASQQAQTFETQQAQQEAEELRKAQEFTRQQELLKQTDPLEVQKMTQEVSAPPMTQQQTIRVQQLQQDRQGLLDGTIQAPPGTLEQINRELQQILSPPSAGMPLAGAPPMEGAAVGGMPPPAGMTSPQAAPVQPSGGYSLRPSAGGQLAFGMRNATIIMNGTGLSQSNQRDEQYDPETDPMGKIAGDKMSFNPDTLALLGNFVSNVERALNTAQDDQTREAIKNTIRSNTFYSQMINAYGAQGMPNLNILKYPLSNLVETIYTEMGDVKSALVRGGVLVKRLRKLIESQGAPPMDTPMSPTGAPMGGI